MQHFIGCDVHTRNQVVAWIKEETGEIKKRSSAEKFRSDRNYSAAFRYRVLMNMWTFSC